MRTVNLDDAAFYGKTARPAANPVRHDTRCISCGTELAGRKTGIAVYGGKLFHTYRCGCGRGRRIEVAAR